MFLREPTPHRLREFDILRRLGVGGVGEVFLARSPGGRLVAIKTIARAGSDTERFLAGFAHEASVCVRLHHDCIVQVRAFFEDPGFAALVFDYVPGVALARVVRLCSASGVRLPDPAAWHIVERVLTALAHAHALKDRSGLATPVVHRDISPSNVLIDWTGGVKIADFGIAKVLGVSPTSKTGLIKGTLGCMAPEQARGESVDERADVYAAALLGWRLLTGRSPFDKQTRDEFELLRAMRSPRVKPLGSIRPDLPEPLVKAFSRALVADRECRTITAAELAETVRSRVDLSSGPTVLGALLAQWKPTLERSVRRRVECGEDPQTSTDRVEQTLRYEEVALAFDEEPAPDSPTLEAHALPIETLGDVPLCASSDSQRPRVMFRRSRRWIVAVALFVAVMIALGLTWLRVSHRSKAPRRAVASHTADGMDTHRMLSADTGGRGIALASAAHVAMSKIMNSSACS